MWRRPQPDGKRATLRVVLISPYELGRQPFGLASPAAWIRREGSEVSCLDLTVDRLDEQLIRQADLVALYLPMHTATRIALPVMLRVLHLNPAVHLCCYGLYAAINRKLLLGIGASTLLGGEYEQGLVELVVRLREEGSVGSTVSVSLDRQQFIVPDRSGLPPLERYAKVILPGESPRTTGYTEASRGCRHLCRHCPVVPVYKGRFRIVQPDVVLEDVRRQVEMGAGHITFGDPDFFNGPGHAIEICRRLHEEHPHLTYDVTLKVEHLLKHRNLLGPLKETGCLFVTSAFESIDDEVLTILDKGHTRSDAVRGVEAARSAGLALHPTFIPFTPWQTREGYRELLQFIEEHDLVEQTAPVQLGLRLLVTAESRLLEIDEVAQRVGLLNPVSLVHPWVHDDPQVDSLHEGVMEIASKHGHDRRGAFERICRVAGREPLSTSGPSRAAVAYLNEPWYC